MQRSKFQNPPRNHRIQSKPKTMRSGYVHGLNPYTVVHPIRASLSLFVKIAVSASQVKRRGVPASGNVQCAKVPDLDYTTANPHWVRELGQHMAVIVGLCQNGSRACGHLLAVASAEFEGGEISSDTVEGLGWLLSELGDLGAFATVVGQSCTAATADFCPPDKRHLHG